MFEHLNNKDSNYYCVLYNFFVGGVIVNFFQGRSNENGLGTGATCGTQNYNIIYPGNFERVFTSLRSPQVFISDFLFLNLPHSSF